MSTPLRILFATAARLALFVAPAPPFVGRLSVDDAHVRAAPRADAAVIGALRRGDEVRVLACAPDCSRAGAWAWLEGDGAVRAELLAPTGDESPAAPTRFRYARVGSGGARARMAPARDARVRAIMRAGEDLAFVPDDDAAPPGWLRRPDGSYVEETEMHVWSPSEFAGEVAPSLPLRFERVVGGRTLAREVRRRARPAAVPPGARWVHVSVRDQTLVAYEDETPVFATLVSTGRADHPTPRGLRRVWHKEIHGPMHGEPTEPYFVDEVPFVQYFSKGMALHGTFWHDRFGRRTSHGCVNLSMTDAEWLFTWAPPVLPAGWHNIDPDAAGRDTLWVLVE